MANSDRPIGAQLVNSLGSTCYRGRRYSVPATDATALFVGDFVKSTGDADADGTPQVIQAAAGDPIRGVVMSIELDPTNLELQYRVASTQRYVYVADDPDLLFEIQETANMGTTAVGGNADISVSAVSTTTGLSGMEIDSASAGASAAQLRILGLSKRTGNDVGTNARWLVKINEHELAQTAGV